MTQIQNRLGALLAVVALVGWVGVPSAKGQTPPEQAGQVELDPIQCWWKTDTPAVTVGGEFALTLTCAAVETSQIRVVPNRTELEPGSLALAPFEIVGGETFEDIVTGPFRYFQYEYTLRLVSDGYFGQDVPIPPLRVQYNIESVENEGTQGRDQAYLLPPLSMRILSLVPEDARDIRDASSDTFGDIENRLFRSTQEFVAAMVAFSFAGVLLALAVARVFVFYRARVPAVRTLPARVVLGGCLSELARLKGDVARDGWTPPLAGRALAALRVAGAVALGRPVAQTLTDASEDAHEGQLVVPLGLLRTRRALVSAGTTADTVGRRLALEGRKAPDARTKAMLEEIRDALVTFNAVRYGREFHPEAAELDRALDNGTLVVRRLRLARLWPLGLGGGSRAAAPRVGGVEWSS